MSSAPSTEWVALARLIRPQGRHGEILADLLTDFPERFRERKEVFLAAPGFAGGREEAVRAEVLSSWLPHGKNRGRIVLEISVASTIDEAARWSGYEVLVPIEDRVPVAEDEVYISDLVGCTLYDRDLAIGVVRDVQFPVSADGRRRIAEGIPLLLIGRATEVPATEDLATTDLATTDLGSEGDAKADDLLVPFAKDLLLQVNVPAKRIDMRLPEGLIDVNR